MRSQSPELNFGTDKMFTKRFSLYLKLGFYLPSLVTVIPFKYDWDADQLKIHDRIRLPIYFLFTSVLTLFSGHYIYQFCFHREELSEDLSNFGIHIFNTTCFAAVVMFNRSFWIHRREISWLYNQVSAMNRKHKFLSKQHGKGR